MVNGENYKNLIEYCHQHNTTLVAVSKTKPKEDILALYRFGQRDFGENYVQELIEKEKNLPKDIRWHFIGHLQGNKVKQIIDFVHLIHGVDSLKLLKEINKQSGKINKVSNCLLQVHIAREETKFGLNEEELKEIISGPGGTEMKNVKISGLMGMASFTNNEDQVRDEFKKLKSLLEKYGRLHNDNCELNILSMGMTGDYKIAIAEGSNMIRVGSLIFGERS